MKNNMYYEVMLEWRGELSPAAQERLAERLAELGPLGWEELGYYEQRAGGWKVYFAETAPMATVRVSLHQLFLELNQALPRVTVARKHEEDWMAQFREQFRTQQAAPGWIVAPPWEARQAQPQPGERVIVIEPGMAFGTGLHETTRLCLEMLTAIFSATDAAFQQRLAEHQIAVIDVGAGSGILSIAAALLGAGRVEAVEIDPQAEENLRLNIALNGCGTKIRLWIQNLKQTVLEPADIVVCNMLPGNFRPIAAEAARLLRPEGSLLLSGLLENDVPIAEQMTAELGLHVAHVSSKGEWRAYLVQNRS